MGEDGNGEEWRGEQRKGKESKNTMRKKDKNKMTKEERIDRDNAIYFIALEDYYEDIKKIVDTSQSKKFAYLKMKLKANFNKQLKKSYENG